MTSLQIAVLAWGLGIAWLLGYEGWALTTAHTSLSRAWWTIELSPYGGILPVILGGLSAHFALTSWRSFWAFVSGFVVFGIFWHRVPPIALMDKGV